jgi:hypothetical protein
MAFVAHQAQQAPCLKAGEKDKARQEASRVAERGEARREEARQPLRDIGR